MKMTSIPVCLCLLTGFSCSGPERVSITVVPDEGYNALFTRTSGWTGGDCDATARINDSLTLWLFADSWVGPVIDNRHNGAAMVNNAVAIQNGREPDSCAMGFSWGRAGEKPAARFLPPDGKGFFWSWGGFGLNGSVLISLFQVDKVEGDSTVFGFTGVGDWLVKVNNPADDPDHWITEMKRIPFYEKSPDGTEYGFGLPQLARGRYVYFFGTLFRPSRINRWMLLARAPVDDVTDFDRWEFYSDNGWQKDFHRAGCLFDGFASEFSVSWQPYLRRYLAIYTELGMSDRILMRMARRPEGPWSEPRVVFRAPEVNWDRTYFCYAAKGHPELSGRKDLLVSYICNSTDFWKMASDARIYRPRFIRIRFGPGE
jgi:hypothetical protein